MSAFEVVTQFEIVVNGRRYFADIAIPGLMIIFEFDGIGKLGKNEADFARAKRDWIQRENDYVALAGQSIDSRGQIMRIWRN